MPDALKQASTSSSVEKMSKDSTMEMTKSLYEMNLSQSNELSTRLNSGQKGKFTVPSSINIVQNY